jgi:hypothetical protein
MKKSVMVLAVPHQLQGTGFQGYVEDESYSDLVGQLIRKNVDSVFEEAAGRGPTIAQGLAQFVLGAGHYLDVDPPPAERPRLGIGTAGGGDRLAPGESADFYEWAIIEENKKREELWKQKIEAQSFVMGLMICGIGHCLSFAFRLSSVESMSRNHTATFPT